MSAGPLTGVKVVEFAGLAPVPFAGLILADFGASVIRIDRTATSNLSIARDFLCRNKRSISVDIKSDEGFQIVKDLIRDADVLLDPYRPGVLEKIGLGPDVWLGGDGKAGENDKLVFARIGGFQTNGPHRDMAGHDINYLALSGILSLLPGTAERPAAPLNLIADFAGGGLMCVLGILFALFERQRSGRGQVVDADMVSGTRYLSTFPLLHHILGSGLFASAGSPRQTNLLDGGAPFYSIYTCADAQHVTVGCIEPQFFRVFLELFLKELPQVWLKKEPWVPDLSVQGNKAEWPALRDFLERGFKLRPRDEWAAVFHGRDACVVPVLTPTEAATLAVQGSASSQAALHPSPAPTLSRTPASSYAGPLALLPVGKDTEEILLELGRTQTEITKLVQVGVVGVSAGTGLAKL
ncbi:CoA-transferase family III [Artomyces pyxidatus]|uniref:CoA-transferase family III n=1 Tax=Artomyces pyxidatus TaxID=48021 RepID=A0ACB8SQS4_9AGAM|nr:CoA-transferase family III [Artomyces pyxidatus]